MLTYPVKLKDFDSFSIDCLKSIESVPFEFYFGFFGFFECAFAVFLLTLFTREGNAVLPVLVMERLSGSM